MDNDLNDPIAYIMLALHGETEIMISFLIPINLATSVLSDIVAVAVIARKLTSVGTRLRTSPIFVSVCRKVSPL